jgi:hypothetical protein
MTIDEKLQHFYEVSLDEAREDAAQAIQEHKEHLARTLEDHKQTSRQNAEAEIKAETGHVRREVNKALSAEQITLRRDLSRKQEELKETLFAEVKTKVQQFITTAEYDEYLCRRINEAVMRSRSISLLPTNPKQMILRRKQVPRSRSQKKILLAVSAQRFHIKTYLSIILFLQILLQCAENSNLTEG